MRSVLRLSVTMLVSVALTVSMQGTPAAAVSLIVSPQMSSAAVSSAQCVKAQKIFKKTVKAKAAAKKRNGVGSRQYETAVKKWRTAKAKVVKACKSQLVIPVRVPVIAGLPTDMPLAYTVEQVKQLFKENPWITSEQQKWFFKYFGKHYSGDGYLNNTTFIGFVQAKGRNDIVLAIHQYPDGSLYVLAYRDKGCGGNGNAERIGEDPSTGQAYNPFDLEIRSEDNGLGELYDVGYVNNVVVARFFNCG